MLGNEVLMKLDVAERTGSSCRTTYGMELLLVRLEVFRVFRSGRVYLVSTNTAV